MLNEEFKSELVKVIHTSLDVAGVWFRATEAFCLEEGEDFGSEEVGKLVVEAVDSYSKISKDIKDEIMRGRT